MVIDWLWFSIGVGSGILLCFIFLLIAEGFENYYWNKYLEEQGQG